MRFVFRGAEPRVNVIKRRVRIVKLESSAKGANLSIAPGLIMCTRTALTRASKIFWGAFVLILMLLYSSGVLAQQSLVKFEAEHLKLARHQNGLLVEHVVKMTNTSNARAENVEVSLPKGYSNLKVEGIPESDVVKSDKGIVYKPGLEPNESKQIRLSYVLTSDFPIVMELQAPYDVELFIVLVPEDGGLAVASQSLEGPLSFDISGKPYLVFQATDVKAGTKIGASITVVESTKQADGLNSGIIASSELLNKSFHGGNANVRIWMRLTGTPGHWGMPGILAIGAVLVALIWALAKVLTVKARQRAELAKSRVTVDDLIRQKQQLLQEIAELDRRHANEGMDQGEYLKLREAHKRKLIQVMMQLSQKN